MIWAQRTMRKRKGRGKELLSFLFVSVYFRFFILSWWNRIKVFFWDTKSLRWTWKMNKARRRKRREMWEQHRKNWVITRQQRFECRITTKIWFYLIYSSEIESKNKACGILLLFSIRSHWRIPFMEMEIDHKMKNVNNERMKIFDFVFELLCDSFLWNQFQECDDIEYSWIAFISKGISAFFS